MYINWESYNRCFADIRNSFQALYEKLKPLIEKLKDMIESDTYTDEKIKFSPILKLVPKVNWAFIKPISIHYRNNC